MEKTKEKNRLWSEYNRLIVKSKSKKLSLAEQNKSSNRIIEIQKRIENRVFG